MRFLKMLFWWFVNFYGWSISLFFFVAAVFSVYLLWSLPPVVR